MSNLYNKCVQSRKCDNNAISRAFRTKATTKSIFGAVIEIRVLKQTSAIYFFKVGIPDLGMMKMKSENKFQNKTNFN
jgi:hypothetical protein